MIVPTVPSLPNRRESDPSRQECSRASSVLGVVGELGCGELGHASSDQLVDPAGTGGLVADDRQVFGAAEAFVVEHRPVGGQLPVDQKRRQSSAAACEAGCRLGRLSYAAESFFTFNSLRFFSAAHKSY